MIDARIDISEWGQIICLTPLYHFSSDLPDLVIGRGIEIRRFDSCAAILNDDVIASYVRLHKPEYVLWHSPLLSPDVGLNTAQSQLTEDKIAEMLGVLLQPTADFIDILRLFKPGRLRAGETFVLYGNSEQCVDWATFASGRPSKMIVDYSMLAAQITSYILHSKEIAPLRAFLAAVLPVVRALNTPFGPGAFPAAALALHIYGEENGGRLDVVGAITALEALMTKSDENEGLTYRLSMRVANLLGRDPESRQEIFQDVKNFYKLRSKIVHGSELKAKLLDQLKELEPLRETLRRVLLSAMALCSDGILPSDLPDMMDALAFDGEKRNQVQETASKFLQIGGLENDR